MYGYHPSFELFVKISLYNHRSVPVLAEILESGGIMNSVFQPYEVHIPYDLQFMMDYNLFGMDVLELCGGIIRRPVGARELPGRTLVPNFNLNFEDSVL